MTHNQYPEINSSSIIDQESGWKKEWAKIGDIIRAYQSDDIDISKIINFESGWEDEWTKTDVLIRKLQPNEIDLLKLENKEPGYEVEQYKLLEIVSNMKEDEFDGLKIINRETGWEDEWAKVNVIKCILQSHEIDVSKINNRKEGWMAEWAKVKDIIHGIQPNNIDVEKIINRETGWEKEWEKVRSVQPGIIDLSKISKCESGWEKEWEKVKIIMEGLQSDYIDVAKIIYGEKGYREELEKAKNIISRIQHKKIDVNKISNCEPGWEDEWTKVKIVIRLMQPDTIDVAKIINREFLWEEEWAKVRNIQPGNINVSKIVNRETGWKLEWMKVQSYFFDVPPEKSNDSEKSDDSEKSKKSGRLENYCKSILIGHPSLYITEPLDELAKRFSFYIFTYWSYQYGFAFDDENEYASRPNYKPQTSNFITYLYGSIKGCHLLSKFRRKDIDNAQQSESRSRKTSIRTYLIKNWELISEDIKKYGRVHNKTPKETARFIDELKNFIDKLSTPEEVNLDKMYNRFYEFCDYNHNYEFINIFHKNFHDLEECQKRTISLITTTNDNSDETSIDLPDKPHPEPYYSSEDIFRKVIKIFIDYMNDQCLDTSKNKNKKKILHVAIVQLYPYIINVDLIDEEASWDYSAPERMEQIPEAILCKIQETFETMSSIFTDQKPYDVLKEYRGKYKSATSAFDLDTFNLEKCLSSLMDNDIQRLFGIKSSAAERRRTRYINEFIKPFLDTDKNNTDKYTKLLNSNDEVS